MKIGIITSGSETLTLFKFLSSYDHEYIVYYDFFHWPYGDKTFAQSLTCVEQGIQFLMKQGVDYIILPPVYELYLLKNEKKAKHDTILPLFTTYLQDYCFKYSLVGKIGCIGDFADVEQIQQLLKTITKDYVLTDTQTSIKKFHHPFACRVKETSLWKYYLTSLSYSHILVNKIIKFDLRYFKDAMVDTLIPLNYGYFNYQPTITNFLNFKKIKFHKIETLEKIFQELLANYKAKEKQKYSVTIAYTGHVDMLKKEKRMMWLLQKGKSTEIQWKCVDELIKK